LESSATLAHAATRTDDSRIYVITTRGLEFLDAVKKLAGFFE
jgi:hypothetical protein